MKEEGLDPTFMVSNIKGGHVLRNVDAHKTRRKARKPFLTWNPWNGMHYRPAP